MGIVIVEAHAASVSFTRERPRRSGEWEKLPHATTFKALPQAVLEHTRLVTLDGPKGAYGGMAAKALAAAVLLLACAASITPCIELSEVR
ncbi:hypothetical protein MCEMSEM23_01220 [Rhabdaerophilaceae bacterium]